MIERRTIRHDFALEVLGGDPSVRSITLVEVGSDWPIYEIEYFDRGLGVVADVSTIEDGLYTRIVRA